jgi:hypothetical protein
MSNNGNNLTTGTQGGNINLQGGTGGLDSSGLSDANRRQQEFIKALKGDQGDYNNLLSDSLKYLKRTDSYYEKLESRIAALNKGTINIRQIQNEITKSKQQEYIAQKTFADLQKQILGNLEDSTKAVLDEVEAMKVANRSNSQILDFLEEKGNQEAIALFTAEQAFKQSQRRVDIVKEELQLEKQINNKLGIAGDLAKTLSEKLGLGDDVYEAMTLKARQLVDEQKKQNEFSEKGIKLYNYKKLQIAAIQRQLDNDPGVDRDDLLDRLSEKQKELNKIQKDYLIGWNQFFPIIGDGLSSAWESVETSFSNGWKTIKNFPKLLKDGFVDTYKAIARGPNWGNMLKGGMSSMKMGWKILGAGASAFFSSIKEKMKNDPLLKYGLIIGGIALAFKGLKKGIDLIGSGAAKAGNALAGMTEDSGNNVRNLTSGISGLVKNIPFVGGLIGGLIDGFSAVLDLIIGIDDKIVKAGRALNMSSSEARALNRHFQDVSYNSGNVFITSKKLLDTYVGIADVLEVTNRISDANLETAIMLKDYAGIEYTTLAEIEKVARVNGNTQKGVVKSVLAQVEGVKKLTGIQFNHQKILKEVSSYTGYLGLQFTKYPAQLTKSVLTVKSLGMEMKDLDSIADGMLDFQSSISKEFEAQLLTGKDMNLSKLRELSLNNDLAGVALEINKQIGSSGEFLKMNRIQQQAYAEAVGMSRDSLAEMLRKQEYLALLGAKDTDSAREQLRLGLLKYKNQQALSEAMGAEAYQNLVNASTQEKLAVTIEKIKQSIVDFIERSGFIEKLENFMNMLTDPNKIKGLLGTIKGAIASFIEVMGEVLADVIEVGGQIKNLFTTGEKGDREEARAYQMAAKIRAGATEFSKNVRGLGEGAKITPAQQTANNQSLAANQYQQNNQSLSNATISNEAKKAKENQTNVENPAKEGTIIRLSVQSTIDTINGRAVVTAVSKDAGVMIDSTTYNKSK